MEIEKGEMVYHYRTRQIGTVGTMMYDRYMNEEFAVSFTDDTVFRHEILSFNEIKKIFKEAKNIFDAIEMFDDRVPTPQIVKWKEELAS